MKRIVIASDSFKGSLSSAQVAECLASAFGEIDSDIQVSAVQVADGGEGTVAAIASLKPLETVTAVAADPLGRKISARYAVGRCKSGQPEAFIEMSAASGLPLLSADERNPLLTSTFGTGLLILDALDRGCRHFTVGIGGSATNDAGTGMLEALGARFLDDSGKVIQGCGAALSGISRIDTDGLDHRLAECSFTVACDVDNPFCGLQGAAYVFGPQKGADSDMVKVLDLGLERFAKVILDFNGTDVRDIPGAGAAGGLGGAFIAFLGARLEQGVDVVLDSIDFDSLIAGADMVITGEGRLDSQTASGKTPLGVLRRAQKSGIPVIAVAGCVEQCPELDSMGFKAIYSTSEAGVPLELAMSQSYTCERLRRIAARILEENQL